MSMTLNLLGSAAPVVVAAVVHRYLAGPGRNGSSGVGAVLLIGVGALAGSLSVDTPLALNLAVLAVGALIAATTLAIPPTAQRSDDRSTMDARAVALMLGALGLLSLGNALERMLGDPTGIGMMSEVMLWPLWILVVLTQTQCASRRAGAVLPLPLASAMLLPLGGLTAWLFGTPELAGWLILAGVAVALPLFPLHGWWEGLMSEGHAAPRSLAAALLPASALLVLMGLSDTAFAGSAQVLGLWGGASILYAGLRALAHPEVRRLAALLAMASAGVVALGIASQSASGQAGAVLQTLSLILVIGGLATLLARMPGPAFGLPLAGLRGLAASAPRLALAFAALLLALIQTPGLGGFAAWWLVLSGASQVVSLLALAALLLLSASVVARALRATLYGSPGPLAVAQVDLTHRELVLLGTLLGVDLLLGLAPSAFLSGAGVPLG